jgi:hypothetical protein
MRQPRNTTGVSPDAAAPSAPIASDGADGFSQTDALDCVMRFGALLLRAGDTAFRVRQRMAMGIEALAVHVTLGGMTATARRGVARTTLATEIAPLGINASRIAALEELASTVPRSRAASRRRPSRHGSTRSRPSPPCTRLRPSRLRSAWRRGGFPISTAADHRRWWQA